MFHQFPETYLSFRLPALDYARDTRIPTNSLSALFPSPNHFYHTVRTRLCRNPSKEFAVLHAMMYKDASIIFRGNLSLEHPLLFAVELFEFLLTRNIISTAQNTFEHIKHLISILPSGSNTVLSLERVENWMDILASSADSNAATLLQRIVLGLPHCLGIQPTRKHHHCVLKTLLIANQAGRAWRWLETMQFQNNTLAERKKRHWWTKLPHLPWFHSDEPISHSSSITWITTQTQDYDLFLTYFAKCGDFLSAQLLIKQMLILGPPVLPKRRSWHLYLLAAVLLPTSKVSTVSAVMKEMSDAGFHFDMSALTSLSGRKGLKSWISEDIFLILCSSNSGSLSKTTEKEDFLDLLPEFEPESRQVETRRVEVKLPPPLKQLSPEEQVTWNSGPSGVDHTVPDQIADTLPSSVEFGLSHDPFYVGVEDLTFETVKKGESVFSGMEDPCESNATEEVAIDQSPTDSEVDIDKFRRSLIKMAQTPNIVNTIRSYNAYISLPCSRPLDIELGSALIKGLCRNTLKAVSKRNVLQAVKIYKDLLAFNSDSTMPPFFTRSSSEEFKIDPTEEFKSIYYILLRNLTAPSTVTSSSTETLETQERCVENMHYLLKEMKNRGIALDSRLIAPIILLRWRSIGSHKEALQFYTSFISDIELSTESSALPSPTMNYQSTPEKPPLVDLASFRTILNSFGQLSFPSAPVTPARLWYALLSHMRARGYISTAKDYALYLNNIISKNVSPLALRYASLGMDPPEEEENMRKSMHDSLKYLYRQITIDVHISPDATLFNTLMNAFQRVGAFDDATQIFNLSWLTGNLDTVTPVIMFDACGHAKRPFEAYVIWNMLIRRRWKFNKRTLDTWVECLCRLGYVDQACKFVCLYMGRDHVGYEADGDTRPDINTCLILLKLSWNVGQNLQVKEKIKSHLPYVWKELSAGYM